MPDPYLLGFGSRHNDGSATDLAADAVRNGIGQAGLELTDIDRLILSSAVPSAPDELSLASAVAQQLKISPVAFGVAFGDASSLLAIAHAADAITSGTAHVVVAGGADTPSTTPYWVPGLRAGPATEPGVVIDPLPAAARDQAAADGGDRAEQDAFAVRSHERAGTPGRTPEALAALKPIHSPDGTITIGNSAAAVDGAAAAVLGDRPGDVVVAGWSLVGPRPCGGAAAALAAAVRAAAARADVEDLVVIELHESSGALCLATATELGVDPVVVNRRGGEIAVGSAGAADGALMVERACRQLEAQPPSAQAVVAAAGPGGQAIALALERVSRSEWP